MPQKLIVTRPAESGQAFADKVVQQYGEALSVVMSPGLRIEPVAVDFPAGIEHVVFTSPNGVAQVPRLAVPRTAHAWCVGSRTAEAARAFGFEATVGGGNASQLLETLCLARPSGQIAHIVGTHAKFDMAKSLEQIGLSCASIIAYDQVICPPTTALQNALCGDKPLVIPLFSARSGLTLTQVEWRAPVHIVAISQDVADAVIDWGADTVGVAVRPDELAMIDMTCATLDRIDRRRSLS